MFFNYINKGFKLEDFVYSLRENWLHLVTNFFLNWIYYCKLIFSIIYEEKITYKGHTGYVTSVCLIPSTEESPEGFTVTGSKDSTILVFIRTSSQPTHTLTGHTDTGKLHTYYVKICILT